jgi:DNA-binding NtrC family response regulator
MPVPAAYAGVEDRMVDSRPSYVPRVLFIEDNDLVVQVVGRSLRKVAELTVASDARAARAQLRERAFDLVVADLLLPDGDGLALLGEAASLCPGARLVLFSALGATPDAERALCEGRLSAVLGKPEGLGELVALVRRWAPEPSS